MEPRLLTVQEAARYLRLTARSVYVLAQRGAIPATRVTGKWLFPVHLLDEWLEADARARLGGGRPVRAAAALPDGVLAAGSDDPALESLPEALGGTDGPLLFSAALGSTGGLRAVGAGRADVAWTHLVDGDSGEYNVPLVGRHLGGRPAVVVNAFYRDLGLAVWTGNPRGLTGVADLARLRLRIVNRQPGSGTRCFLDAALARAGVPPGAIRGYGDEVTTHWGVGLRVLRGEADAGLATRAVARALSLAFVPLTRERFDLVVPREIFFRPAVQELVQALRSRTFGRVLERLGGYDPRDAGRVLAEVA